ncbi:MAG: hypothetical protein CMN30_00770 [Sandaracinus sp.]|nr:hypothetical protein [Sandaracinus sp.]
MARVVALSLFVLAGCADDPMRIHLADAAGLTEGSPVEIRGVVVGEVKAVHLRSGEVEVLADLENPGDLDLRDDACAAAGGEPAKLVLVAGTDEGRLRADAVVPACTVGDLAGQLGDAAAEMLRGLGAAIEAAAAEEASAPAPSPAPANP